MRIPVKIQAAALRVICVASVVSASTAAWTGAADEFSTLHDEFGKYYRQITGRDAPEGVIRLAVDPKVSKSGRDAYAIQSAGDCVAITGSNLRSVWYGLYDLLERRGGCHWFWDGDVVPKKELIDLSNLDVHEEAQFEYRAIRYFAHRGLTRFQAEHWGPEDWKKEIDWLLKRRLNTFMLRIGQDDLFPLSFPDACEYPDPAKPLPGTGKGFRDRSLFWSLQYRGELRRNLQKYAFERGLMVPEDFGTMTHWYSFTPPDFLEKKKPSFIPQASSNYLEEKHLVWDFRKKEWLDAYWNMTETAIREYGQGAPEPRLLHTIGLGERMCSTNRVDNFKLKVEMLDTFLKHAHEKHPEAKILVAGWDFYYSWTTEEVKKFIPHMDPARDILWDYEGDVRPENKRKSNFTTWDVIGKFPYTFSAFLAYESALDARAYYPLIEERQKLAQNDPFCKGYVFWPESSHTDTLFLRFFTENAWSAEPVAHEEVLRKMCDERYGANAAAMEKAWLKVLPATYLRAWTGNYSHAVLGCGTKGGTHVGSVAKWGKPVADASKVFAHLAEIPWRDAFTRRDTIDIARTALDRIITFQAVKLSHAIREGRKAVALADNLVALCDRMADILELHTDYSIWESYLRLDAIEKIRNPDFAKTLFDNVSCAYCRSHQYELARYWYARQAREIARCAATSAPVPDPEKIRRKLMKMPLEKMKPTLPRTEENFRRVMRETAALCAAAIGLDAARADGDGSAELEGEEVK